jgi:hypothetical protein
MLISGQPVFSVWSEIMLFYDKKNNNSSLHSLFLLGLIKLIKSRIENYGGNPSLVAMLTSITKW